MWAMPRFQPRQVNPVLPETFRSAFVAGRCLRWLPSSRHPNAVQKSFPRAFSVPIESERRLYFFVLTRFLDANRHPLRWKTLSLFEMTRVCKRVFALVAWKTGAHPRIKSEGV